MKSENNSTSSYWECRISESDIEYSWESHQSSGVPFYPLACCKPPVQNWEFARKGVVRRQVINIVVQRDFVCGWNEVWAGKHTWNRRQKQSITICIVVKKQQGLTTYIIVWDGGIVRGEKEDREKREI